MRELSNVPVVVVGAAKSGLAAARLLRTQGADVFLTDSGTMPDTAKARLAADGIAFEDGGHTDRAYAADFLVISPGVPTEAPIVQSYLNAGKKVYSEIELASWFERGRTVAVTGSNGKTTTASWLDHLWSTAKAPHLLAGNIGIAYSDVVLDSADHTTSLLEISSFQLDHIDTFRPTVGILLNITPDHLNRYQYKFENYAASKMRMCENQREGDVFIYWHEDPVVAPLIAALKGKPGAPRFMAFSDESRPDEGIFVRDGQIFFHLNHQEEFLMLVEDLGLRGRHNLHNGLATALAARVSEIKNEFIRESLMRFEGVEHRLETVRTLDGVSYINDSKATNVNAVWYALDSVKNPLVLILGGRDKGNDYSELIPQIHAKVHTIVAIGEGKAAIETQLREHVPNFLVADSMEQAVRMSKKAAKRGESVLLSPACASFDMFENYEHRGREFKKYVNQL
jgi:UDP-N-acetylmuramoylalanine--D-glutamate ligase